MREAGSEPKSYTIVETERKEAYERLCEGKPDALYILARDIVKNEATGEYKSGSYGSKGDVHGLMGGAKARSIAAAELHRFFPEAKVVANSWIKTEPASFARVTAEELQKRGVDEKTIILQENSYSTFTELLELIKLIAANDWHHVSVITSDFHIPRSKAMLEHIDELHDPNGYWEQPEVQEALKKFKEMRSSVRITFVSAEEVLLATSPHYKKVVDEARGLPAWKTTMEMEQAGTAQVLEGTYWKNLPPTSVKQ
ncbi:MAG: YdcF family protein [bacterium]|nr:YdcF family protein [bacterium]